MAVPTITSVTPSSGTFKGGTSVVLVGTGFTGTTGVSVGGTAATSFTVTDNTHLAVVVPAKAASATPVHIVVTNATGPSVAGAGDQFTYAHAYVQPEGASDGTDYFMDVPITPAALKDGSLVARFDPVLYPQRGLTGDAKVGAS